uniref:Pleckstrin homology domain containing A6 n=1 Tax=Sphenodon punctatus TaxID=8508 RepID=A0A8D0G3W9_SPHPU
MPLPHPFLTCLMPLPQSTREGSNTVLPTCQDTKQEPPPCPPAELHCQSLMSLTGQPVSIALARLGLSGKPGIPKASCLPVQPHRDKSLFSFVLVVPSSFLFFPFKRKKKRTREKEIPSILGDRMSYMVAKKINPTGSKIGALVGLLVFIPSSRSWAPAGLVMVGSDEFLQRLHLKNQQRGSRERDYFLMSVFANNPQALANSTVEYENLESEVSALHDDLWEQLNLDIQNEILNRQIQKEIWRIQDVMEGLRKNNPSRGTDTAKHRGELTVGPSGTYSSNSPASPLSSASLTSPLSPFSLVSGSQGSPTKQGSNESKLSFEQNKKDLHRSSAPNPALEVGFLQMRQEQDAEKQAALNKVGIVPPRTKSPTEEETTPTLGVMRRSASNLSNGLNSRERPKSAVFSNEMKAKMSVEEQIDRMKRHQSGSMKEKRRSLQLPANQQQAEIPSSKAPTSYKVVRRHRSIHEVDISDLEAALRSEDSARIYETPREEIARLRKMELEPQHYDVDINKELSTPDKVLIPERYVELEPDTPLSPEEMKEKQKKVERIKTLIAKSSLQNVVPLSEGEVDVPQDPETQLQEQEKRIEISCTLATEASRRGRMLSAQCATPSPPTSPASLTPPTNPLSSESSRAADNSHFMRV